jgi:hypothetical protein
MLALERLSEPFTSSHGVRLHGESTYRANGPPINVAPFLVPAEIEPNRHLDYKTEA